MNKYYNKTMKLSLKETYRRLLKDKYCKEDGSLVKEYHSFRKFNYYFYKTVKKENLIISREGKSKFMRNHRALLGGGINNSTIDLSGLNDEVRLKIGNPRLIDITENYINLPKTSGQMAMYKNMVLRVK